MFQNEHTTSIEQVIALVEQLAKPQHGRTAFVVTAKGDEVKTAFRVVEASDLIVSNNGDGTINPAYPAELQPRDRTRLSSKLQVNSIAKSIRPAQLGDSGMSSHGAPIIGPDNVVESGNGRTMGLIRAYGSGHADGYRQYLIDNAKLYGLPPATVEKMRQPVLVRVRLDDIDRVKFAKDSNISDLQEMAASEKAFVDADSIVQGTMALFQPGESGDLLAKSNQAFIQKFMTEIGATAAAGLMTEDGRPTRQLVDRMQNAIFAKAYKNERLVKLVAEEPDPELRNVLTALNVAAPDFVEMQYLSGEAHKGAVGELIEGIEASDSLDEQAMKSLIEAIGLVRQAKDSGQHIEEVIAQQGMFSDNTPEGEALALFIVSNNRSAKRMGRAFKILAQKINDELTHQQHAAGDMFGGGEITLPDILKSVGAELEAEFGEGATIGLFEAAGAGKSLFFPAADNVDDLIDLIGSKVWQSTGQLGRMVGRYLWQLIHGQIQVSQYTRKVREVVGMHSALWERIAAGGDLDFVHGITQEYWPGKTGGLNTPYGGEYFILNGEVGDILKSWQEWLALPDSASKADKQEVAKALMLYWRGAGQWASLATPPRAIQAFWEMITDGQLDSFAWQNIIASANGEAVRLRGEQLRVAHDAATANGTAILSAQSAVSQVKDSATSIAAALKAELLSDRNYLHQFLYRAGPTEFENYVSNVTDAIKMGRMGFHSAKVPGYVQGMRNLSASGKKRVRQSLTALMAPVANRLYWMTDDLMSKQPASNEDIQALFNGIQIDPGLKLAWEAIHGTGMMEPTIKMAIRLSGGKISTLKFIYAAPSGERASASRIGQCIKLGKNDGPDVLMHEIGHHFEYSNPNTLGMAIEYLKSRQDKARLRLLASLCPGYNYRQTEKAIEDKLSEPYIGKVYGNEMGIQTSTEVFSMAFQYLYDHQSGAESIVNGDGLLEFAIGVIKGVHNGDY